MIINIRRLVVSALLVSGITSAFSQTSDVIEGCVPLSVNFSAPTNLSYYWDFKDGSTSTLQNPNNIFSIAGTYQVSLKESVNGNEIGTKTIKVYAAPELKLNTSNTKGCPSFLATIESESIIDPAISINSYSWGFGNGLSRITSTNSVSNTYNTLGKFDVTLSINTNLPNCNRTTIFPSHIEVVAPPNPGFSTTPNQLTVCTAPLAVTINNTATGIDKLNYSWSNGKGQNFTTENIAKQNYTNDGSYLLTQSVSYDFGCTRSTSVSINIGKPEIELELSKDTICSYSSALAIPSLTSGIFRWINEGEYTPFLDNVVNPTFGYELAGPHEIQLIYTAPNGLCSDTATATIFVDVFKITASSTPDYACTNPSTFTFNAESSDPNATYNWSLPKGMKSTKKDTTIKYIIASDTLEYGVNKQEILITSLSALSSNGCKADTILIDTVWKPNAYPIPTVTKGCVPLEVKFNGAKKSKSEGEITEYHWIFGDGKKQTTTDTIITNTYDKTGIFEARLVIKNNRGCVDTSFAIEIQVGDHTSINPIFTTSATNFCWNEEVTFTNKTVTNLPYSYKFFTGTVGYNDIGFDDCNNPSVNHTFKYERGTKDVGMEIDYNGCFTQKIVSNMITIKGAEAQVDYFADCSAPLSYFFDGKNSKNYTSLNWMVGDSAIADSTDFTFLFDTLNTEVDIILSANNDDGCDAFTDTIQVTPTVPIAVLNIPNLKDTNMCVNIEYNFLSSASQNASAGCRDKYTWLFPGNSFKRPFTTGSSSASFTFSQDEDPIQTIQLIAKDVNGCKDTTEKVFKIYDMNVDFKISDNNICLPALVSFIDSSKADTTLSNWTLTYGDGLNYTGITTFDSISHNYTGQIQENTFSVKLNIQDILGCTEELSLPINQYVPRTSISISDVSLCSGDSITIAATSNTSQKGKIKYLWDFGNGSPSSTTQSNLIKYQNSGDFIVKLAIEEDVTGCKGIVSDALVQVQDYPTASYTTNVDGDSAYCADLFTLFTDNSTGNITSRLWTFDNPDDNIPSTSLSLQNPQFTFKRGNWTTKYQVNTSFGCADTNIRVFNIIGPNAKFTKNKSGIVCQSEEIIFTITDTIDVEEYSFNFGDGFSSENQSPTSHAYSYYNEPNGIFPVKLLIKGQGGCEFVYEEPIKIMDVVAKFTINNGLDTARCLQLGDIVITDNSINVDNYTWNFGNNQTSKEAGNKTIKYENSGNYEIQLIATNNNVACVDTLTKRLTLYPTPNIFIANDTACIGEQLNLVVSNPIQKASYLWSPLVGLSADSLISQVVNINKSTEYAITVIDSNSCRNDTIATAFVIDQLDINDYDTTIVVGDQAILPVYGAELRIFTWSPPQNLSCLNCNYPIANPIETVTYTLNVKDHLNCFDDDYDFKITVRPETFIKMPSTFSPNNDGKNDIVYVKGWGIKELESFKIFNRWGELIYESSDIDQGWDGTYLGKVQNSDAYAYKIVVKTYRDETLQSEGYINLIH